MARRSMAEALAAHPEGLPRGVGTGTALLTDDEQQEEFAALLDLGRRLRAALLPVEPPAAFVRSLRREFVSQAARQAYATTDRDPRRTALVAAAAVGSLISVASVVGALVYVVTRRRARMAAQPARASM